MMFDYIPDQNEGKRGQWWLGIGFFVAAASVSAFIYGPQYIHQTGVFKPAEPAPLVVEKTEEEVVKKAKPQGMTRLSDKFQTKVTTVSQELDYGCQDAERIACTETCKYMIENEREVMQNITVPAHYCPTVAGVNHEPAPPMPESLDAKTTKAEADPKEGAN